MENLDKIFSSSPKKYNQLDLPFSEKLEKEKINWGPKSFLSNEKMDPDDYHSENVDVIVEIRKGEWFLDKNEKPTKFSDVEKVLRDCPGLKVALMNEEFKKIYNYYQRNEEIN